MSSTAIVSKVSGAAFVIRGGQEIAISQGMELEVSDSIRTGMNGQCELRFADETEVQLSPMSQVQIQDFAFNPDTPAENSFAMHMMEGLVRTVSGEVVKLNPEGFALSTPLGTAGIRGTTVIAQIFPTHVVFMVTEMGAGHKVVINSVFGGDLTILMPGQGAEISLTEQQRITLIDSMPENMREAVRDFFENQYDDIRSSHDNFILLFGDLEFLAAVGAEDVGRGVGMLSAENEEILIELLQELGVEQPEFFLEAEFGPSTYKEYIPIWGDEFQNSLMPTEDEFGENFKNLMYDIRGFEESDEIVSFNGEDIVYGGQGDGVSDTDVIYKISAEITSGSLIVGGDETLTGVSSLDSDEIILRSQGNTPDDYSGWTSQILPDYGATVMSGGSVVGSAVNLSNSSGGGNSIDLYGTMTGGAIYGSAINSSNNNLSGNFITISPGLGADGVTPTGGLLAGGAIYGDAQSITGGTAGSDSINVYSMTGGVIYGDAATGSAYTPGENTINIETAMSGGTINSGDGDDSIRVGTLSGSGIINSGTGDDSIGVTTMSGGAINASGVDGLVDVTTMNGGTINTNGGNNDVKIATAGGGTLVLGAASKAYITDLDGAVTVGNGTVAQNVEVANLNSGGTLTTGAGADLVKITTASGGTLVLGAASAATITDLNGAVTASNGTVAQKVTVENFNSSSSLTTGAGNDVINITTADGGTIKMGGGSNQLEIDRLDNNNVRVSKIEGDNSITVTDGTDSRGIVVTEMAGNLVLGMGYNYAMLNITEWTSGSLDYSECTGSYVSINIADTGVINDLNISSGNCVSQVGIHLDNATMSGGTVTFGTNSNFLYLGNMSGGVINSGAGGYQDVVIILNDMSGTAVINNADLGTLQSSATVEGKMLGSASIVGNDGKDYIKVVKGMAGDASILSGAGYDVIDIGSGDDSIAMNGDAVIYLGDGGNELTIDGNMAGSSQIVITGLAGMNIVDIDGYITDTASISGSDSVDKITVSEGLSGGASISAGGSHDIITVASLKDNASIDGGSGYTQIKVGNSDGSDVMTGNAQITLGNSDSSFKHAVSIFGNMTGGSIIGNAGDDSVYVEKWDGGSIALGAGADVMRLDSVGDDVSPLSLDLGADSVVDIVDLSSFASLTADRTINITNVGAGDELKLSSALATGLQSRVTGSGVYEMTVGSFSLVINCTDSVGAAIDMIMP